MQMGKVGRSEGHCLYILCVHIIYVDYNVILRVFFMLYDNILIYDMLI